MISRRLLVTAVLTALTTTACNDSNNNSLNSASTGENLPVSSSASTSASTQQKPYYTENGSLVIPDAIHTLEVPPEGYFDDLDPFSVENILPPEELYFTENGSTAQQNDSRYAKRFVSNVTFMPAGAIIFGKTCGVYPDNAKIAMFEALRRWEDQLNSPVPITIEVCWTKAGQYAGSPNTLASAAPTAFRATDWFGTGPQKPIALANALAGKDVETNRSDIQVSINGDYPWWRNPYVDPKTANPPLDPKTFDLTTILAHELGHGLGFLSSAKYSTDKRGSWGSTFWNNSISPFDDFLRDNLGRSLRGDTRTYPNNSAALGNAFTSGGISFAGSQAVAANGGRPVRIESGNVGSADLPLGTFKTGSSISHLDSFTYPYTRDSGRNSLMTHFVPPLTRRHDPGPIAIAMLRDIGWGGIPTPAIVPSIVILSSPIGVLANGAPTYNWKSVADATYYLVTVRNAATKQVVLNQQVTASVAGCAATSAANCSFKPAGTGVLRAGNYEWYVNAGNNVGLGQFSPTMPFTVK